MFGSIRGISALVCVSALTGIVAAQGQTRWQERFEAREFKIPMRDGVELHTVVYIPKGKTGPFPILMERTPYGAGTVTQPPRRTTPKIVDAGYILAFQDVRGLGRSAGDYVNVRPTLKRGQTGIDESTDTYDTIEYLLKNVPSNSGRVGMWGISYPGFYAGAGAIRNHPALKAVSPQAPVTDWFLGDDVHHRGAFFLQETFDFMVNFDVPRGGQRPVIDRQGLSAYDFFLQAGAVTNFDRKFLQGKIPYWFELLENDTYNDYWKGRSLSRNFREVKCAVLTVGGWFDKEDLWGALNLYRAGERQNRGIPNYLVMGPWSHGQWAGGNGSSLSQLSFGSRTGQWYQENVEFPFFERYLRGDMAIASPAEATVFETGSNQWHRFNVWPPKESQKRSLFLKDDGTLSWQKPGRSGFVQYLYDPTKPTPYLEDFATSRRAPGDWLARNQKFLEGRGDVATFRMEPLTEAVRIAGPIVADLWIQTTGTDADFVVQLIDEYPSDTADKTPDGNSSMAGYQMMVRGEIIRAKFRNSFEKPEAIRPNTPTRVRLELNDAMHTFRPGHRLVVRVMSSWFPVADRNPNVFRARRDQTDADFRPATIQVLTGGRQATRIELGVLPSSQPSETMPFVIQNFTKP